MASKGRPRAGNGNGNRNGNGKSQMDLANVSSQDLRLQYGLEPYYSTKSTGQQVLGSDYIIVEPIDKVEAVPKQVDFELPATEPLLFGPMSKFRIRGTFQKMEKDAVVWTNLTSADASQVMLSYNWLDMLIRDSAVIHNNMKVSSSTENRFTVPFVNAYLYQNMEPMVKKLLCPQPSHPGHCVPAPNGKWSKEADAWTGYAKSAFPGRAIGFDYVPLGMFPFQQGGSYMSADSVPRILPVPAMGKIQIRFTFTDSQDHIFRKLTDANKDTKYRFAFSEFKLVLEEARLSVSTDHRLKNLKQPLAYPGNSRIQLVEYVTGGSTSWKARFQNIYLPEAVFIFCLDKSVATGAYKFSADNGTALFAPHNLDSVDLSFGYKRFSIREPQIGTFRRDEMDAKSMYDHLTVPPFGISQDPKFITCDYVANGSSDTACPHIYIPLIMGPNGQRRVPWNAHPEDFESIVNKKADLDVELNFTENHSPDNTIFVIYVTYSDVATIFDPQSKLFSSPYLQYMN
jgi:hypothetical protein